MLARLKRKLDEQRWARQDSASIRCDEKVLFVDLGANLGQGYTWFKHYFSGPNVSFELFEPNPNCIKKLEQMDDVLTGKVTLYPVGVGKEEASPFLGEISFISSRIMSLQRSTHSSHI